MKYKYVNEKQILIDLERIRYDSSLASFLIFYAKVVNEPDAHNKSYRVMYAFEILKIARGYLGDEFDWTLLPIDIDTHVLPELVVENPVAKKGSAKQPANKKIIAREAKIINSKFTTFKITAGSLNDKNVVVDASN